MRNLNKTPDIIDNNITRYIKLIKNLPLFINLQQEELEEILKHSHVSNYKKGLMLFLKGEKALNLYIVLKGWVKLFDSNIEGEELIIEMIGPEKIIVPGAVLLNSTLPVSARILKDSEILSIPATFIREYIKNNSNLTNNMLINLANQSDDLTYQLERITLKTAKERIGCFLLDLFLKNGKENSATLPYSKFLIASHLSMKPETFSRALKDLEKDHIIVNKNKVTLSDEFVLCEYCDNKSAYRCIRHNNGKCPNCNAMNFFNK